MWRSFATLRISAAGSHAWNPLRQVQKAVRGRKSDKRFEGKRQNLGIKGEADHAPSPLHQERNDFCR